MAPLLSEKNERHEELNERLEKNMMGIEQHKNKEKSQQIKLC
jgi:hypothetical protein